jgi:hypothetical protein
MCDGLFFLRAVLTIMQQVTPWPCGFSSWAAVGDIVSENTLVSQLTPPAIGASSLY